MVLGKRRGTLAAVIVGVVAVGGLAAAYGAQAQSQETSPLSASAARIARAQASLPPVATRIAKLKAAETKIAGRIAAGRGYYGDINLKDLRSFGLESLWNKGIDGAGTSVAVIEGWNLPSIQTTLNALDNQIGLPHTTVQTVYPTGPLPATCPAGMQALGDYGSCEAWGGELTLDVEAVHLFAPYAKIIISATPADSESTDDRSSQVAPPEMMKALEYLSTNHLADAISISDGSNEGDYSNGPAEIHAQDPGELTAAANSVPVVNATGDCGAAQNLASATGFCNRTTPSRAVATWDDSPFVTALGGVIPNYTYAGAHGQDGFSVWNDGGQASEGAGLSLTYGRPSYQDGVAGITGSTKRALPDITMDSASGTSQAAPQFAAILALATQVHKRDLGAVNAMLYQTLGKTPQASGLVDVTVGNNTAYGVTGFTAAPGYDVASGWGTINAATFVPALARAATTSPVRSLLTTSAQKQLAALSSTATATPAQAPVTGSVTVTARGFLPAHPVTVSTGGAALAKVTADAAGNVTYTLVPSAQHLTAGQHTITLTGLLLTQNTTITLT